MYKRKYSFRMNAIQEILQIRSCVEILANDIGIFSTVNKELQGVHVAGFSSFER